MKFQLGQIVATRGALSACNEHFLAECLRKHAAGDWGVVDPEDKRTNNQALRHGDRLLSAYTIDPDKPPSRGFGDNTLWIITEADRSVTTFLLPSEY